MSTHCVSRVPFRDEQFDHQFNLFWFIIKNANKDIDMNIVVECRQIKLGTYNWFVIAEQQHRNIKHKRLLRMKDTSAHASNVSHSGHRVVVQRRFTDLDKDWRSLSVPTWAVQKPQSSRTFHSTDHPPEPPRTSNRSVIAESLATSFYFPLQPAWPGKQFSTSYIDEGELPTTRTPTPHLKTKSVCQRSLNHRVTAGPPAHKPGTAAQPNAYS